MVSVSPSKSQIPRTNMPTTPTTSGGGNSWNTRPQLQKDPLGWVMAAAAEAKNCVSPRNFPRSPSKGNGHWEKSRPKVLLQKNLWCGSFQDWQLASSWCR